MLKSLLKSAILRASFKHPFFFVKYLLKVLFIYFFLSTMAE
jgi:hypothetical protein